MRSTAKSEVIVVGAGPTGLLLAGELARRGVACRVLERRLTRTADHESRALALHARTLEILDLRGLADELVADGNAAPRVRLALGSAAIELSALPSRFAQLEIVPQGRTEAVLEASATALGARVERGIRVVGVRQDDAAGIVELDVTDGAREWTERAGWVVGCDGAWSTVRQSLGIAFEGAAYPWSFVLADVRLAREPAEMVTITPARGGLAFCAAFRNGWYRLGLVDRARGWSDDPVTLHEVADVLRGILGYDAGPSDPLWAARFRIEQRQAATYQRGRVLLAGDAAHIHSPLGGQGLNLGLQEAMNLGWKLAATVRGDAPEELLATYTAERRRVSTRVIRATDLATRVMSSAHPIPVAARRVVAPRVLASRRRNRFVAGRLAGIGVRYVSGGRRGAVGRRLPDVAVLGDGGAPSTLATELRSGQFVLVDGSGGSLAATCEPWRDRVRVVRAAAPLVAGADGVLSRPDGYCAWAGNRAANLANALARWCGPPPTVAQRTPAEAAGPLPAKPSADEPPP